MNELTNKNSFWIDGHLLIGNSSHSPFQRQYEIPYFVFILVEEREPKCHSQFSVLPSVQNYLS